MRAFCLASPLAAGLAFASVFLAGGSLAVLTGTAAAADLSSLSDSAWTSTPGGWPLQFRLPDTAWIDGFSIGAFGQAFNPRAVDRPVWWMGNAESAGTSAGGGVDLGWVAKWSRTSQFAYGLDADVYYSGVSLSGTGWTWRSAVAADTLGRAGFTFLRDNLFLFGEGGATFDFGERQLAYAPDWLWLRSSSDKLAYGLAFGGGAELQVAEHVTLRGDVLWKDLRWGTSPHWNELGGRLGFAWHF